MAWVRSLQEFQRLVSKRANELGCVLIELENVQLLESRMKTPDFPEELITMRETATRQPGDTVFGAFFSWQQDESN